MAIKDSIIGDLRDVVIIFREGIDAVQKQLEQAILDTPHGPLVFHGRLSGSRFTPLQSLAVNLGVPTNQHQAREETIDLINKLLEMSENFLQRRELEKQLGESLCGNLQILWHNGSNLERVYVRDLHDDGEITVRLTHNDPPLIEPMTNDSQGRLIVQQFLSTEKLCGFLNDPDFTFISDPSENAHPKVWVRGFKSEGILYAFHLIEVKQEDMRRVKPNSLFPPQK